MLEEAVPQSEQEKVDVWKLQEFRRLGFDEHDAELLVAAGADLHDTARMLTNGCPLTTALLILV